MAETVNNDWFLKGAWKARNELYIELFGEHKYVLPTSNQPPIAPKRDRPLPDLTDGSRVDLADLMPPDLSTQKIPIIAYGPAERRPYWTYVTSGLSNPWFQDKPDEVSGFACELMLKAPKDSRWAVRLLRRLSYYILTYSGTISPGVMLNMASPVSSGKDNSQINNVVAWYADEAPDAWYQLPSGGFGIFCIIGITEDECKFAESVSQYGVWCIQQVLRQTGIGQVTDPGRKSVMESENIADVLASVKTYAENFREHP